MEGLYYGEIQESFNNRTIKATLQNVKKSSVSHSLRKKEGREKGGSPSLEILKMGLDDTIFDSELDQKILDLFLEHKVLEWHSESAMTAARTDAATLDQWETEVHYTGYSVVFHSIYPVALAKVMGFSPFGVTDHMKTRVRAELRDKLLKILRGPILEKKRNEIERFVASGLVTAEEARSSAEIQGIPLPDSLTIDVCGHCGREDNDGDVKLKHCTACYSAKYCSVDCQKAHRPKHKKECKKKAAELKGVF